MLCASPFVNEPKHGVSQLSVESSCNKRDGTSRLNSRREVTPLRRSEREDGESDDDHRQHRSSSGPSQRYISPKRRLTKCVMANLFADAVGDRRRLSASLNPLKIPTTFPSRLFLPDARARSPQHRGTRGSAMTRHRHTHRISTTLSLYTSHLARAPLSSPPQPTT